MIRLRKVALTTDIRKNRSPLFYWSLGAGFITTVSLLFAGYHIYNLRIRQKTRAAVKRGDPESIIDPSGLTGEELTKAIAVLEQKRIHDQIQLENFERYKRLRDKRRGEEGF